MTWADQAARALTETLEGSYGPGVAVASAAVNGTGTAWHVSPGSTPADGRLEIGSVTKTMTATLLALLAADGTLRLDDPVSRWLDAGRNGHLTVRQLATHTSGLPRVAPNFPAPGAGPDNIWAGYTCRHAEEGLRQAVPAPGSPHLYSNLGYQLLALVLERAAGQDYPGLLTGRLLRPLAMTCSGAGADGGGIPLPGHRDGAEVPRRAQPPGAGGVEAAIGDLARYARACLHPPDTPLGAALAFAQQPQLPVDGHRQQALGWVVHDGSQRRHDGGTRGFSASLTIDPGRGRAVAVLASTFRAPSVTQAALLALAGQLPAQASPQPPWPAWEQDARDTIRALIDGRAAEIHPRLIPGLRDRIPAAQLQAGWNRNTADAGQAGEITVSHQHTAPSGVVTAEATIAFARRPAQVRIAFAPTGQIAALRFPTPPAEPGAPPSPS